MELILKLCSDSYHPQPCELRFQLWNANEGVLVLLFYLPKLAGSEHMEVWSNQSRR